MDPKNSKKKITFDEDETQKIKIIRKNRLDYASHTKTVSKYEKAKLQFIKENPDYKPVKLKKIEYKKESADIANYQTQEYKKLGIKGLFGEEEKLDEIEQALLEKQKKFIIKKKKKEKEAKIDVKIK